MEENNNNKKRIIFLVLTLIMCLSLTLGAIYFMYYKKDTRTNNIESGLISIDFAEGGETINLVNTVPVIDEIGLGNAPYEFTVTNTSSVPINAKIQLDIDPSTTIPLGAVRYAVYVNDELLTKSNLGSLVDNTLYTYPNMAASETANCKLVFWVDYYYTESAKTFLAKVKVTGESIDIIVE